jgi:hypothetical protein
VVRFDPAADGAERCVALGIRSRPHDRGHRIDRRQFSGAQYEVAGDAHTLVRGPRQREADVKIELVGIDVVTGDYDELVAEPRLDLPHASFRDCSYHAQSFIHAVEGAVDG